MPRLALCSAFLASTALLGGGCSGSARPEPFAISVRVESDPGKAIVGATVSRGNRPLGMTGLDGRVTVQLPGVEGEITDVVIGCPEGFLTPAKPINIRLTRLAEKTKIPEYAVQCPPAMRRVVVAVRADGGPHLPVMYLDKAVTRTDGAGAASFALEVPPGSQFTVALSTAERKDMKPTNPSKLFVVGAQDDVFLFDQKFESSRRAPPGGGGAPSPAAPHTAPRSL